MFTQTEVLPGQVNFAIGQPSPELLPLGRFAALAKQGLLRHADPLLLQYGLASGYEDFRHRLASFLESETAVEVSPEQLCVTSGNSGALDLICSVFVSRGDTIVCADPTYMLAKPVFETHQLNIVPVKCDDEGIDIDSLEHKLVHENLRPAFVYCIPTYQNPTAGVMGNSRRHRLVQLAQRFGFVVVSDEPYNLLRFQLATDFAQGVPPGHRSLFELSDQAQERVVTLGSFSKILGPGLRLGWLQASTDNIRRFCEHGVIRSGGGLNPIVSALVEPWLSDTGDANASTNLGEHIARLRRVFSNRRTALLRGLGSVEDVGATICAPLGGYFSWLRLPRKRTVLELRAVLDEIGGEDVSFMAGERASVRCDLSSYLRLSWSFHNEDEIFNGAKLLRCAIERL